MRYQLLGLNGGQFKPSKTRVNRIYLGWQLLGGRVKPTHNFCCLFLDFCQSPCASAISAGLIGQLRSNWNRQVIKTNRLPVSVFSLNLYSLTHPAIPPLSMWLAKVTSSLHTSNCHFLSPKTPQSTFPVWIPIRISTLKPVASRTNLQQEDDIKNNLFTLSFFVSIVKRRHGTLQTDDCFSHVEGLKLPKWKMIILGHLKDGKIGQKAGACHEIWSKDSNL